MGPFSPIAHPISLRSDSLVFLAGTFGWAWLLWGYWVVAMPAGGLQLSPAFLATALAGGFAPSLAAFAATRWSGDGRDVRQLAKALFAWRSDRAALAVALLAAPGAAALSALAQAGLIGALAWPDPSILTAALVWPLLAALGEEFGWRGFLLPRLMVRNSLLVSAVVIGIVWGVWHLPADYIALKGYGAWFWIAFVLNGPVGLTAHSLIMAWLWRSTRGSLPVAMLYHVTLTASAMLAPSAATDAMTGVLAATLGAASAWAVAAFLLVARPGDFRP